MRRKLHDNPQAILLIEADTLATMVAYRRPASASPQHSVLSQPLPQAITLCLLSLSVFYQPGYLNTMADDAPHWFDIYPHRFPALFHSTYNPQYPSLLQLCHPPTEVLSSVISTLCRQLYEAVTSPTAAPSLCIASSLTYVPTSSWTTCSSTWTFQLSILFRCTEIGSVMVDSAHELLSSGRTWLQRCDGLSPRPTFWRDAKTRKSLPGCTQEILISTSPACSKTLLYQHQPTQLDKANPLGFFMAAAAASNPSC